MFGLNRVFIMGYLGADPESHTSKKGKSYVRLRVSTHQSERLDNGELGTATVWHRVTVWGKTADKCRTYLRRGSALMVEGSLSRYKYVREDGTDASDSAIIARQIHFIDRKPREESASQEERVAEAAP